MHLHQGQIVWVGFKGAPQPVECEVVKCSPTDEDYVEVTEMDDDTIVIANKENVFTVNPL